MKNLYSKQLTNVLKNLDKNHKREVKALLKEVAKAKDRSRAKHRHPSV